MRRPATLTARIALGAAALALIISCAGAPPPAPTPEPAAPEPAPAVVVEPTPAPEPEPAPEPAAEPEPTPPPPPVRMERLVTIQTPLMLKETVYYPDGLVDEYSVLTWDESKQRLLAKTTFDPSRAEAIEKVLSEYDSAGVLVAELTYGSDGSLKSRRETTWGTTPETAGLLLAERGLDAKGLVQYSSTYEYDQSGHRSAWKAFDAKGALKATTLYKYDADNRLALIEIRNSANVLTSSIKVASDGETERRAYLASDGSLQKTEVALLKDGLVVRFEIRRPDNSLAEASEYTLGPLGEHLGTVTMDGGGRVKEKRNAEFTVREDQKVEVYYE